MRRSSAPSQKSKAPLNRKPLQQFKVKDENKAKAVLSPTNPPKDKRLFNILWNKVTSKKHKTWEFDGFLEVRSNNVATARAANGLFIGSTQLHPDKLFSGSQIVFGGKQIEIQEEVSSVSYDKKETETLKESKKPSTTHQKTEVEEPPPKKMKTHPVPKGQSSTSKPFQKPLKEVETAALRPHQLEGVEFIKSCIMGTKNPDHFGAILTDEMGLGKTLQCLTVCKSLLKPVRIIQKILIVTPSSLTSNWNNEINKWLDRLFAYIVEGKNKIKDYTSQLHIPFVIVSYEMLLSNLEDFKLVPFDLLILDEGHRLKNKASKLVQGLMELQIPKKILLTGTPIQNNLQEFYSLVDFVNPGILGSYSEFKKTFENPISASCCPSADESVIEEGRSKSEELNQLTKNFILRRTQEINKEFLPKKHEFVVFVQASELQQKILKTTVDLWAKYKDDFLRDLTPLQVIGILSKICNHPSLITRTTKENILTRNLAKNLPKWDEMGPFDSGKLEFVHHFLTNLRSSCQKVVIVSNFTKTLDMIQGLCEHLEVTTLRLDGTVPSGDRNSIVKKFGSAEFPVFLLSSKAGGVGLNLSQASNLILFDSDWNPAVDSQAMSRIWRDGQKDDVRLYRLITCGTIEEKIFQRQLKKLSFGTVIKEDQEFDVKFSKDDLEDLFVIDSRNFSVCGTHEAMGCCVDGERGVTDENQDWKHYKKPFNERFLAEAGIIGENVLFVFSKNDFLQ